MKTSEVLYAAANEVDRRGWTAGDGWENCLSDEPTCVEGAIAAAMGMNNALGRGDGTIGVTGCTAYRAVRAYLGGSPFIWNDNLAHGRVKAAIARGELAQRTLEEVRAEARDWARTEVIATLRAAAVIEAARETADERTEAHA